MSSAPVGTIDAGRSCSCAASRSAIGTPRARIPTSAVFDAAVAFENFVRDSGQAADAIASSGVHRNDADMLTSLRPLGTALKSEAITYD
jgi:hypothetical protein